MKRLALTGFAVLVLASGVAAAQQAQDEGNAQTACAKLESAARTNPKVSTRMQLASCYDRLGLTASAWSEYHEVAKLASQDDKEWQREMMALDRIRALEKKLVRLTIAVAGPVAGQEIRRNGVLVPAAQLGTAVPVDPGEVTVTATAAGYEPFTVTVKIAKEKVTNVDVPPLRKAAASEEPRQPSS
jgi:Flp pilus assembly protein TadD